MLAPEDPAEGRGVVASAVGGTVHGGAEGPCVCHDDAEL